MTLGLGYAEIAIILVLALIVVGPRRLPDLMRNMGKIMGQLRRASDELRREVLFSEEINQVKDTVRDAIDPTDIPEVPPKLRTKSRAEKQDTEQASDQESPPSKESGTDDSSAPEAAPAEQEEPADGR